eukprot:1260177-Rhodomonas_salina.2
MYPQNLYFLAKCSIRFAILFAVLKNLAATIRYPSQSFVATLPLNPAISLDALSLLLPPIVFQNKSKHRGGATATKYLYTLTLHGQQYALICMYDPCAIPGPDISDDARHS